MANRTHFITIFVISVFFIVSGGVTPAEAKTIYVDDDAVGVNYGSSWMDAFNYLQDALAVASDGDEILVAQGIYTPDSNSTIPNGTGDRGATFQLTCDITIRGGYAGLSQTDPPDIRKIEAYRTILSGDLNGDDVDVNSPEDLLTEPTREDNVIRVVICSGSAVLDGLTITGGNTGNQTGGRSIVGERGYNGSGIYHEDGNLTIINCLFYGNFASSDGGGIYNNVGELDLKNCTFTGNYAGDSGGGIYTNSEPTMDNCTFTRNSAKSDGGGIYNSQSVTGEWFYTEELALNSYNSTPNYPQEPSINNCTFIENTASRGAGIYNNAANPAITNCKFIRNATNLRGGGFNSGGGMYNHNSCPTITNCVFTDNFSAQDGGGIYNDGRYSYENSLILTNCVFNGNRVNQNGGAIYIEKCKAFLINCTFAQNSAELGDSLACESLSIYSALDIDNSVEIINCIFWDGVNSIWKDENSIVNASYSDIYGGWEGIGNIDEDPLFVYQLGTDLTIGTEDDDLRLSPVSPCVNTGDPNYPAKTDETDIDGNPRIVSGLLDMGAYEFQGLIYVDDDAPYDISQGEPQVSHLEEDGSDLRPFDTIQEAIDAAIDGYTVLVRPGLYGKIDFMGKSITVTGTEGVPVIASYYLERGGQIPEDAVTFHTGEGRGSVFKNFIIKESNIAISLNYSSPKIHNVTIVDNNFGIAAYDNSNPDIRNCILWNNKDGDLFQCEAKYSCIENGTGGEGNINVNPLFVDEANNDYHLKSEGWRWNAIGQSWTWDDITSRCIDAGDPCSPLEDEPMSVPRDPNNLYGENLYINMGAYGGTCQASMPPLNWLLPEEEDITAPTPNPAQWATDGAPREVDGGGGEFDYWVWMKAATATDASGYVEYFFECTSESGFSSGWQTSPEYSILVGRSGQGYRFRVKVRDSYGNETAFSDERTAH